MELVEISRSRGGRSGPRRAQARLEAPRAHAVGSDGRDRAARIPLLRVLPERSDSEDRPAAPAIPLIGRERELGELRGALDVALDGRGRVVLLTGEPGIGKTRLASALAAEAELRRVPVWSGRGWEDGSAPSFWPWSTSLRRWIDRVGSEAATELAGPWAAELAHVFSPLREGSAENAPSENGDCERARFRVFEAVSRFLAAVAAPSGLVVVLDDLHWADLPSLKLLEFLAANVDARLLVVAAYRDTEVHGGPLCTTLSRIAREPATVRIGLGGLSPAHCARWIAFTGMDDDATALGETLHRETNGNPFFVGEIVHLLASDEDFRRAWDTERRVPYGVREVIGRRLDRLCSDCRATLAVAALLGETIETSVLAEVLAESPVTDHLELGLRDGILIEVEGRPGGYAFAHALLRRVLADEIQRSTRAAWHARIASVLERRAVVSEVVTTELVHHFAAAESPGSLRKAFEYACTGAEQAARELGWEEAVRLYEIALAVGARSGAVDAERAIELRLALARALRGAGDVPAARARCAEVQSACRRTKRPNFLARAALIHVGPTPEFGRVSPAERAVLEEACRDAEALDDGLRARLYARLAGDIIAANETEQTERVLALCDEAATASRRAGDAGALAMALLGTYYASALRLRPRSSEAAQRRRVPSTREILETAEAAGEHEIVAAIRHLRAAGLFAMGEADAFSSEVDGLTTAALASRVPDALCLADSLAGLRALVEGRFDEGHARMERSLAMGRRLQLPNAVGRHMSQRILSHLVRGRLGEIAAEIDAFVEEHPGGAGWQPIRALAHLGRGDVAAARAELQTLLAAGLGPTEGGVMSRSYLGGLALLCIELGDRESAPALHEAVTRQREAWIIDGCHTFGPWSHVQGGLARLCGHPAEAVRHFETAIALARRMRARPFLAAAQASLAEMRLSMDPRAARDEGFAALIGEAERTAAELGLLHVGARVERLRSAMTDRRETATRTFRCDGDVWTVSFGGRSLRLKDGKGPRYLATLLATPGREIHVLELAGNTPAEASASAASTEGLTIGGASGVLEDAPDARATREYRERLEDLRAELADAEQCCDSGRAERIRSELDVLTSQLAQRFGTRSRTRGPAETARKAVTKVLRTQIGKLLESHPPLGEHLRDFLRMGTFCSYTPPAPVDWDVSFAPG